MCLYYSLLKFLRLIDAQNTDELERSSCKDIEIDKFIEEVIEKLLYNNVLKC